MKGDGKHPHCSPCLRSNRECIWPAGSDTTDPTTQVSRRERLESQPTSQHSRSLLQEPPRRNQTLNFVSARDPEFALRDTDTFSLLRHYIAHLASWYDLNDHQRHFTDLAPVRARQSPLLLSAILAFSAASKRHSDNDESLMEKAAFYHLESVQILLQITSNDNTEEVISNGEVLAAICLLRSYEIIARQFLHLGTQ